MALTKFLLLTDKPQDLREFKSLFEYVLARADFHKDLCVFSQTAFDTLDYASGKINHGSKAILMGLGEPVRELPARFDGELPAGARRAELFCRGCLVVEGPSFAEEKCFATRVANHVAFADWPVIVLQDDASVAGSCSQFLWATWTRFDPASDIHASQTTLRNNSVGYEPPIVIDARIKPWYPKVVEPAEDTVKLVDNRWNEYFRSR